MEQKIDGDNNIQVGQIQGDINIDQSKSFDKENPNIIDCPQCWKQTGRYSDQCVHCGYGVLAHFQELERQAFIALKKKQGRWIQGISVITLLSSFGFFGTDQTTFGYVIFIVSILGIKFGDTSSLE